LPAPQLTHEVVDVAPVVVEYQPAPQPVQLAEPKDAPYCPATHAVHTVCPDRT